MLAVEASETVARSLRIAQCFEHVFNSQIFDRIGADEAFWKRQQTKRFATFVFIKRVFPLHPFNVLKSAGDRRPWLILRDKQTKIEATHEIGP